MGNALNVGDGLSVGDLSALESYSMGMSSVYRTKTEDVSVSVASRQQHARNENRGRKGNNSRFRSTSNELSRSQTTSLDAKERSFQQHQHILASRHSSHHRDQKKSMRSQSIYTDDYMMRSSEGFRQDKHKSRSYRDNEYSMMQSTNVEKHHHQPSMRSSLQYGNDYSVGETVEYRTDISSAYHHGYQMQYEARDDSEEIGYGSQRITPAMHQGYNQQGRSPRNIKEHYAGTKDYHFEGTSLADIPPAETDMAYAGSNDESSPGHKDTKSGAFEFEEKEETTYDPSVAVVSTTDDSIAILEQQEKELESQLAKSRSFQSDSSFSTLTKTINTLQTGANVPKEEYLRAYREAQQEPESQQMAALEESDLNNPAQQQLEQLLLQQKIQEEKLQKQLEQLRIQKERLQQLQEEKQQALKATLPQDSKAEENLRMSKAEQLQEKLEEQIRVERLMAARDLVMPVATPTEQKATMVSNGPAAANKTCVQDSVVSPKRQPETYARAVPPVDVVEEFADEWHTKLSEAADKNSHPRHTTTNATDPKPARQLLHSFPGEFPRNKEEIIDFQDSQSLEDKYTQERIIDLTSGTSGVTDNERGDSYTQEVMGHHDARQQQCPLVLNRTRTIEEVMTSIDDEIDLDFVAKYDRAFTIFLDTHPDLFDRDPEFIQYLKVAKLQRILEASYQAEVDLEAQLEGASTVKSDLEAEFQRKLKEASRQKAERSIQLQSDLSHMRKKGKVNQGKLTWELLQLSMKRIERMKKIQAQLDSKDMSSRQSLILSLPEGELRVKEAILATPKNEFGLKERSEVQQYQVDNAFLSAEVKVLEQKVASLKEATQGQAWVDEVLTRLSSEKVKKLRARYQKKLGVNI